ncbi:MAG: PilZ domain-containing protein [Deltaproteobacteria bacterium]|nr:PilZ domain-containing protein [Deltaproteobacteria bacterium]
MEWTGVERREGGCERMKVGKSVSIFAGDKQSILRARTKDLSTGGMRIDLGDGLSAGEKILFRIDLGEGFDPAVQGGEVVWSAPDVGTGVRFTAAGEVEAPATKRADPPALPSTGDGVRLHIDSMDHHLKVECVEAGPTGITVRTELPFLERGRAVRASFCDADGVEGQIEGILTSVSLEPEEQDPVPGIRLRIRTTDEPEQEQEHVAAPPQGPPTEDSWQEEEPTSRDASPPAEIEQDEPLEEESGMRDEEAMSDAFNSLTSEPIASPGETEPSIEPSYVIVLRAVAAWLTANGRRAVKLAAASAAEAWCWLLPVMKRVAPRIIESVKMAGDNLVLLLVRLASGRLRSSASPRPTKLRKQKRRTTQASIIEKASKGIASKARSRVLAIVLLVAALAGFGTGVWGVVSLITSGKDDGPASGTVGQPAAEVSRGSFDMWGDAALPAGNVVEPSSAEIEMVVAGAPAAAVEAAPAVTEAVTETPEPVAAVDVPQPAETTGSGFYLSVSGEVTGYDYYALKSPPGLVVDVKGALPLKEGTQPVNRPGIKKVKAVSRESGARFIIYFDGEKVPDFQVLPAGSSLEVRLDS